MSKNFGKNSKTLNFTKIHNVVEIVLFDTDGRTWRDFFTNTQNLAICPKTFSNSIDIHCYWHAADTSSDISPIKAQSQLIDYGLWGFYRLLV
jgi:hypothetical protein